MLKLYVIIQITTVNSKVTNVSCQGYLLCVSSEGFSRASFNFTNSICIGSATYLDKNEYIKRSISKQANFLIAQLRTMLF